MKVQFCVVALHWHGSLYICLFRQMDPHSQRVCPITDTFWPGPSKMWSRVGPPRLDIIANGDSVGIATVCRSSSRSKRSRPPPPPPSSDDCLFGAMPCRAVPRTVMPGADFGCACQEAFATNGHVPWGSSDQCDAFLPRFSGPQHRIMATATGVPYGMVRYKYHPPPRFSNLRTQFPP